MHIAARVSIFVRQSWSATWLAVGVIMASLPVAIAQAPSATVQSAPEVNAPADGAPSLAPTPVGGQPIDPAMRETLARFGTFQTIATFGEVWKPTIVPADWRPYAACHWVNSRRFGWYYDDRTAWGAIIHHYGRWTHVVSLGWVWVPGAEFSPGWVAWRASPAYIGWAPLPPTGDLKGAEAAVFENGGFWTFMETPVFDKGCGGAIVLPVGREAALLTQTQPVTTTVFVGGILIAVLPDDVVGPLVDIVVSVKPWPSKALITILSKWNVAWNSIAVKTVVNVIDCDRPKRPRPPRNPPPRANPCLSGAYLQPDGRCARPVSVPPQVLLVPSPPPVCADGARADDRGMCPAQQAYTPIPPPPIRPPPALLPPVVAIPLPLVPIEGCRNPGFVREPDGRCRRPRPPTAAIPLVIPPPPVVVGPSTPPITRPPVIAVQGCRRPGFVRQPNGLCRRPGAAVVATVPFVPPSLSRPPRPVFAPPATVGPRPIRIRPSRPVVTRPAFTRPTFARPKFGRPASTVRRPCVSIVPCSTPRGRDRSFIPCSVRFVRPSILAQPSTRLPVRPRPAAVVGAIDKSEGNPRDHQDHHDRCAREPARLDDHHDRASRRRRRLFARQGQILLYDASAFGRLRRPARHGRLREPLQPRLPRADRLRKRLRGDRPRRRPFRLGGQIVGRRRPGLRLGPMREVWRRLPSRREQVRVDEF